MPSGGARPNFDRPGPGISTRPNLPNNPMLGGGNRPNVRPPSAGLPISRPGSGSGGIQRPPLAGIDRPGGIDRPANINRPGNLPGINDRPGISTLPARPGIGNIANRPGAGGGGIQRPGIGNDPFRPNRPVNPSRPIIGGGGNNIIGGGNINNITNNINRPVNLPANNWGYGNNWHDHWHNHGIYNHYHGWYNGCWGGGYWYAPFGLYWGASALNGWGYSPVYSNPYYVASAVPAYDYSQPVVVNNYVSSDADGGTNSTPAPAPTSAQIATYDQGASLLDEALALFKSGDYAAATAKCDAALKKSPGDAVIHEVRALTLFAQGKYTPAAAALNSLLATAPGMNWTTMSGLYPDNDTYTKQLRALETYCRGNPKDSAAAFVLAYHYMVLDENKAAADALRQVVKLQPKDAVAQRLLDNLEPPTIGPTSSDPNSTVQVNEFQDQPTTDLVGQWQATSGNTTIELDITDDAKFTWTATPKGKSPIEVKGEASTTNDTLSLDTKDQGVMNGVVKSGGADKFRFTLVGAPSSDPGLMFTRVK
jgi:tetratricopeptide (TPR) repeat protein